MPIIQYPYNFDPINLEIFPEEIYNDQYIAYHGTSTFFAEDIEANGFRAGIAPFDLENIEDLLIFLENPRVVKYDGGVSIGIRHYLDYINSNGARISLTSLSAYGILFANGALKGGQSLNHISKAKSVIDTALNIDPSIQDIIPNQVNQLFQRQQNIQQVEGVVYAIRIPNDLHNLQLENDVIYTAHPILVNQIIAKVDVPNNLIILNQNDLQKKLHNKLFKSSLPLGIGVKFRKDDFNRDVSIKIIDPI